MSLWKIFLCGSVFWCMLKKCFLFLILFKNGCADIFLDPSVHLVRFILHTTSPCWFTSNLIRNSPLFQWLKMTRDKITSFKWYTVMVMKTTSIILWKIFLDNLLGCIWNCSNIQYQCLFTCTIIYFKGWSSNYDNSLLIQTVASCYGSLISIISYRITVSEIKISHSLRTTDGRRMSLYFAHAIFQQRQSKTNIILADAWFQASAVVLMRSSLLQDFT